MWLVTLILAVSPQAECNKTGKEPMVIVRGDKNHYVRLLEGEEAYCDQLVSDFNSGKALRACGCAKASSQYPQEVVRLRCAVVADGKLYSSTVATYYYYPDSVPACVVFRDRLNYEVKR